MSGAGPETWRRTYQVAGSQYSELYVRLCAEHADRIGVMTLSTQERRVLRDPACEPEQRHAIVQAIAERACVLRSGLRIHQLTGGIERDHWSVGDSLRIYAGDQPVAWLVWDETGYLVRAIDARLTLLEGTPPRYLDDVQRDIRIALGLAPVRLDAATNGTQ